LSLNKITKGFFIVRQKRIPTILAQGISIGTTKKGKIPTIKATNGYLLESFLTNQSINYVIGSAPKLGRSIYQLTKDHIKVNALLCPEASIRKAIFGSLFNSSSFVLHKHKYQLNNKNFDRLYNNTTTAKDFTTYGRLLLSREVTTDPINSYLLLVDADTNLISNKKEYFSSVAGNPFEP